MCGIAGIAGPSAGDRSLLAAMAGTLAHRGPDDEGFWVGADGRVGLAHRRLAIVDLSAAGHQPMASASGRLVLCYNGEIYNHAALRTELEADGAAIAWRGHSDSETLVEAIDRWGLVPTLRRARGMFAFALVDLAARTLSLVRDRFGEKPLYWGRAGRDLVFASELKALRAHPDFDAALDRAALAEVTARGYISAPRSIFAAVRKLPAAHLVTLDLDAPDAGAVPVAWWSHEKVVRDGLAEPFGSREGAVDAVEAALRASVEGQVVADVPVGAFLSGGIDSSLVTALYQSLRPGGIDSFTIGFDAAGHDESGHARAIARHLGTRHHELTVTAADAIDVVPRLADIYDEPFADSSQVPTVLVSRLARRHVTVALSGDGGDELFAGYERYERIFDVWRRMGRVPRPARRLLGQLVAAVPPSMAQRAMRLSRPGWAGAEERLAKLARLLKDARGPADLLPELLDEWERDPPLVTRGGPDWSLPSDTADLPFYPRMMLNDAGGYLVGDILTKVDRAAMSASLETRVPMLDPRVVEAAARVPTAFNLDAAGGKAVLRDVLARHVPRALFERPKQGFAMPLADWLRGPLRGWAEELLDERRLAAYGLFDAARVRARWRSHLDRREDASAALWSVLMIESWRARSG